MKAFELIRDVNAHIQDLECSVNVEHDIPVAKISFSNMAFGAITAIKFNAQGLNVFGDIIKVNNMDKFFLVIQDIDIKKNDRAINLSAKSPDLGIRQLVLEENQICFADGSVVLYEDKNEVTFEIEEFDTTNPTEKEQSEALKEKFNTDIKFKLRHIHYLVSDEEIQHIGGVLEIIQRLQMVSMIWA